MFHPLIVHRGPWGEAHLEKHIQLYIYIFFENLRTMSLWNRTSHEELDGTLPSVQRVGIMESLYYGDTRGFMIQLSMSLEFYLL